MSNVWLHSATATAVRTWLKTLRRPVPLTFSFVQPLFWMLTFGFLFHRFSLGPTYAAFSYLDFLLPGVATMTVLFGASQAGISIVRDLQTGMMQRMARAAVSPSAMLAGKIGADVARLLAQAVVVALLGVALGAQLRIDATIVAAIATLALFAIAYAGLSCWIALKARTPESMAVFVHLMNMPLLFTSTALVPSKQMPAWLEAAAQFNPLSLAADSLRHSLLLNEAPQAAHIATLAALAIACYAMALHAMKRAARS